MNHQHQESRGRFSKFVVCAIGLLVGSGQVRGQCVATDVQALADRQQKIVDGSIPGDNVVTAQLLQLALDRCQIDATRLGRTADSIARASVTDLIGLGKSLVPTPTASSATVQGGLPGETAVALMEAVRAYLLQCRDSLAARLQLGHREYWFLWTSEMPSEFVALRSLRQFAVSVVMRSQELLLYKADSSSTSTNKAALLPQAIPVVAPIVVGAAQQVLQLLSAKDTYATGSVATFETDVLRPLATGMLVELGRTIKTPNSYVVASLPSLPDDCSLEGVRSERQVYREPVEVLATLAKCASALRAKVLDHQRDITRLTVAAKCSAQTASAKKNCVEALAKKTSGLQAAIPRLEALAARADSVVDALLRPTDPTAIARLDRLMQTHIMASVIDRDRERVGFLELSGTAASTVVAKETTRLLWNDLARYRVSWVARFTSRDADGRVLGSMILTETGPFRGITETLPSPRRR